MQSRQFGPRARSSFKAEVFEGWMDGDLLWYGTPVGPAPGLARDKASIVMAFLVLATMSEWLRRPRGAVLHAMHENEDRSSLEGESVCVARWG